MKIKVCGITMLDQLIELQQMGIDYAGMIFYEQSSRFLSNKINAKEIQSSELAIQKVGVFVNASEKEIMKKVEDYSLDVVQLHGDETPVFCANISSQVKVIKAFRLSQKDRINIDWMIKPFEEACDYYLLDTKADTGYGGTGEKFNWSVLEDNHINKPFFLSGGIGINDAERIRQVHHPHLFAIDLNSGFELQPGVKEMSKIRAFKQELNENILLNEQGEV